MNLKDYLLDKIINHNLHISELVYMLPYNEIPKNEDIETPGEDLIFENFQINEIREDYMTISFGGDWQNAKKAFYEWNEEREELILQRTEEPDFTEKTEFLNLEDLDDVLTNSHIKSIPNKTIKFRVGKLHVEKDPEISTLSENLEERYKSLGFKNESDLEFEDISSELFREYYYKGKSFCLIKNPLFLNVSKNGHRVYTQDGYSYYVNPSEGWHIKWLAKEGEPNFIK